jgi:uncharacterized protein
MTSRLPLNSRRRSNKVERLSGLLEDNPVSARCILEDAKGGGRTSLHLFAD